MLVLLIEDDARLGGLISRRLNAWGMGVAHVTTLKAALDALPELAWEAILLDLWLPDSKGLQTLERIREHTELPIVILSGHEESFDAHTVAELGADWVDKPAPASYLAKKIRLEASRRAIENFRKSLRAVA